MKLILFFLLPIMWLPESRVSTDFSTLIHPEVIRELGQSGISGELEEKLKLEWALICKDTPEPIFEIRYEGLLDNNPARVKTVRHLVDMDKLALFSWHYAIYEDGRSLEKMKEFSLSWAETFKATGNPINENKLLPVVYAYIMIQSDLNREERETMRKWLIDMAVAEIDNDRVPLNNWETKRINLVGTIGIILENETFLSWAEERTRYYLEHALFSDGTSRDIRQRDAISYHVSGLKPLLQFLITLENERGRGRDFFHYSTTTGASIARSLDFVVPYARGEKVYRQWENSKVPLDQERASAGLEKYQPGVAYDPEQSYETMAMAGFFDSTYQIDSCDLPLCTLMSNFW